MPKVLDKVLIVEDEQALLAVLAKKFTIEKFKVFEAPNGQIGLEQAFQHHPDIILLDILMPIMDGMTMLNKLRQDPWGKSVPIIMLTNLSDEKKEAEAAKEGCYDYFIKSDWNIDDLVKKVKSKLKQ
ncbi:MAG: response regulator [Candidatus Magasanikbacteria bacterium]|nr:response regulator [Candidatus Magasanikbacteria bacterium]